MGQQQSAKITIIGVPPSNVVLARLSYSIHSKPIILLKKKKINNVSGYTHFGDDGVPLLELVLCGVVEWGWVPGQGWQAMESPSNVHLHL